MSEKEQQMKPFPLSMDQWVVKVIVPDLLQTKTSYDSALCSRLEPQHLEFSKLKNELAKKKLLEEKRQQSVMRFFW